MLQDDKKEAENADCCRVTGNMNQLRSTRSILVHCSDGWDRTAQLTSMVQLLTDPYYRTLKGIQVLIAKEWCFFGHMFSQRYGVNEESRANYRDKQRSPIFVQWLDSVWQILTQFPKRFEFNSLFLEVVFHHLYSSRYGTFLFDCVAEREANNIPSRTQSLWEDVEREKDLFVNPAYDPSLDGIIEAVVSKNTSASSAVTNLLPRSAVLLPHAQCTALRLWPCYAERWLGYRKENQKRNNCWGLNHGDMDRDCSHDVLEEADEEGEDEMVKQEVKAKDKKKREKGESGRERRRNKGEG